MRDSRSSSFYRCLGRNEPAGGRFVGDVDLHFDADRLLFSMPDAGGHWQVFEIGVDGAGLRKLTGEQPDVDSYDACYLPDGKIAFTSSAYFNAVACTGDHAAVVYVMDADGRNIRQLTFDQEHDWCPAVPAATGPIVGACVTCTETSPSGLETPLKHVSLARRITFRLPALLLYRRQSPRPGNFAPFRVKALRR